jgi:hypothetical protein
VSIEETVAEESLPGHIIAEPPLEETVGEEAPLANATVDDAESAVSEQTSESAVLQSETLPEIFQKHPDQRNGCSSRRSAAE